jgi:adenylylsulfate kinase
VWITGLPASGKSSLARELRLRLLELGRSACVLDGDEVRGALVPPPGYDATSRDRFYETLARLAAMLACQGLDVIVAATAHRVAWRERARRLAPRFVEAFVATPADECARRDPKGLWAAAQRDEIQGLPGGGAAYEPPERPDVIATGGHDASAVEAIVQLLGATFAS